MSDIKQTKIRVISGVRPTGPLHLGNYFGAIKGYLELQDNPDYDCLYFVADLHGITSPYNPQQYPDQIKEIALEYLACGLNPHKSHLFIQSLVPQHLELAYLLATIYPVSRLEQLPTYKEKKQTQPEYVNLGLLYYPILMAADILLYEAELVPVGKDQLPHLEVSREIARKFNKMFGQTLKEPQAYLTAMPSLPSLTGEGKMSKSNSESYLNLLDDEVTIRKKIAKVPTDSGCGKQCPKEGGVAALLALVELFEGKQQREQYEKDYTTKGLNYQHLKEQLAHTIFLQIKPIQEKRRYYEVHFDEVVNILLEGQQYAQKIANRVLKGVKDKMGLRLP
ncbi:MAG: Tryptophan--tRNA ligase [Parcubacteria group bacterium ADurb.Bin305]|nr:tryptophan--tRNA ligase [Candidatus Paceibacterota bacterium]OQA44501.1 MAG: Tryptophan--tRNA ligase [Parcubacteria group bacterium ADurb.Bin305]